MFTFTILKRGKKKERTGCFKTPHGNLYTPELAFVATEGEIRAIPKTKIGQLPAKLIITNTYHLYVKKIVDKIPAGETIHDYSGFKKTIFSDSGGFQVFSLGFGKLHGVGKIASMFPNYSKEKAKMPILNDLRGADREEFEGAHSRSEKLGIKLSQIDQNNPLTVTEEGVEFIFDGEKFTLTPEKSMEIQHKIGADVIFAFDECTSPLNTKEYVKNSMERTHRWLKRCLLEFKKNAKISVLNDLGGAQERARPRSEKRGIEHSSEQALFAIVQGGHFEDLRKASAAFVGKQDVPGFGIGGSFGKNIENMYEIIDWTIPLLPDEKPRHLLGIGTVVDIFEGVEHGIDLFDCVIPTREARHKVLYTKKGKLALRKMKTVKEVIEKDCACEACSNNITMEQLYGYFLKKDPLAFYYATVHNIQFFSDLMKSIREAIESATFFTLKDRLLKYY